MAFPKTENELYRAIGEIMIVIADQREANEKLRRENQELEYKYGELSTKAAQEKLRRLAEEGLLADEGFDYEDLMGKEED